MSSYAEIASHGPKQTDAEKIPPHVPEILHDDASVHSLNTEGSISIDHPSQPPSYADQQKQAEESAARARATADKTKAQAEDFGRQAENKAAQLERDGKQAYDKAKKEVKKDYNEARKQVNAGAERVKKDAKKAEQWAEDNKGNPVVIGNVVVVGALAGLIGIGAYRKYIAGELTWKVAGTWAGVVGLFAAGDYLVSSWLFKNKYPPKQ